jgi:hypothetical protein
VANKIGDEKSSMRGFTSFLEVLWSCSVIDEGKVLLDVVDSWEKPIGPDWFAMPSSLRILGSSCSRTEPSLLMLMHRRNTSDMPVQSLAGPPYLAAAPVHHSHSHKV